MKRAYFIAVIFVVAFMVAAVYLAGGEILLFISAVSFILTPIVSLILMLCTFSPAEMVGCFTTAFKREKADEVNVERGVLFFQTLQNYLLLSGIFSTFLGIVLMLANLEDPEAIGPGLAVALLTILYALFLIMIVTVPFKSGLKRMLIEKKA
ncbi:MotA/TolQ/ExbB proton channel family protein [candidate division KSB1 bacterium]